MHSLQFKEGRAVSAEILRIRNWEKYQHYSKRRPPWIKLHFSTLTSKDWVLASDSTRLLAIVCMLIASQSEYKDGRFEADPEYFQRLARLDTHPSFKPLIELGFLESASGCTQMLASARTETEAETYTETEKPRTQTRRSRNTTDDLIEKTRRSTAKAKRLDQEQTYRAEVNVGAGPTY